MVGSSSVQTLEAFLPCEAIQRSPPLRAIISNPKTQQCPEHPYLERIGSNRTAPGIRVGRKETARPLLHPGTSQPAASRDS